MKKFACLLTFVVLFQFICPLANVFAQQEGGETVPADPLELYKKAGIDSDQEGEIRKMMKEFESAHRVRMKSLFGLMKDMRSLQLQANPSEDEVLAKQDEINKLSGEIATERIKLMLKIRKLLSPSQRQRLVQLVRVKANVDGEAEGERR